MHLIIGQLFCMDGGEYMVLKNNFKITKKQFKIKPKMYYINRWIIIIKGQLY